MDENPTILIVEDEPAVVMLYEDYFGRSNVKTLYATSSVQAIDALESSLFVHLVFLDKSLADGPGKGQAVLDCLNARKENDTDFPIVLTVSSDAFFEKGVYESLTKAGMRLAMKEHKDPKKMIAHYLALAAAERKGPARLWIGRKAIGMKRNEPHS